MGRLEIAARASEVIVFSLKTVTCIEGQFKKGKKKRWQWKGWRRLRLTDEWRCSPLKKLRAEIAVGRRPGCVTLNEH